MRPTGRFARSARIVSAVLFMCALGASYPTPTGAQSGSGDPPMLLGGDLLLATEYNWRGITRVDDFVLQPDLYFTVKFGSVRAASEAPLSVAAGMWANIELSDAGADDLADRAEFGLGELNPWLQLGVALGDADISLGATRYFYRGNELFPGARSSSANTTELFASLSTTGRVIDSRLSWWLDVDRVRGSYFETEVTAHIPFLPVVFCQEPCLSLLHLAATAGWSAGQGLNSDEPEELANFEGSGLTHLGFSLSTSALFGPISIEPRLQLRVNRDAATKRSGGGRTDSVVVWWAVVVSPVRILGFGG